MANTLRFKRGLASGIPTALAGEPLFTTDTFDLYIGNGTTNTRFQKYIASGATTQILRGDGSLYTFPLAISSPTNGQVLKYNGTNWVNDSDAGITGSGSAGQVAYFTGATTQAGSNNLFYSSNILTITHPTGGLPFILNNGATTGTIESLRVRDNTASQQTYSLLIGTGQIIHRATWLGGTGVNMNHVWANATSAGAVNNNMTLYSTGNLGIATSSDSGEKLQVTGTMKVTGNFSGGGIVSGTEFRLNNNSFQRIALGDAGGGFAGGYNLDYSSGSVVSHAATGGIAGYRYASNGNMFFFTGTSQTAGTTATVRMTLDNTGNLGLGVTPSAWTTSVKAIQVGLSASIAARTGGSGYYFSDNLYMSSDPSTAPNGIYLYSAAAATYRIAAGQHFWYNAPSGTAGNAITFTQAMTLDASGNLGIGTTTPSQKLTVYGGSSLGQVRVGFADNANWEFGRDNSSTGDFILTNNIGGTAVEGLRLKQNTARVLIGSSTDSGERLQVTGTAKITGNLAVDTNVLFVDTTNDRVGIGTATPATRLEIVGATGLQIRNGATDGFNFQQSTTNSWSWTPLTSGSNYNIQNSNVGIGTATPLYKLDVQGTSNTVGIRSASSTAGDILYYATGTVTGSLNAFTTSINATGSVGASLQNNNTATGSAFLDINVPSASTGDPYLVFTTSGATNWSIGTDNSDSDKLKIGPNSNPSVGTPSMTLDTSGNLGLGTTSPSRKLSVVGTTDIISYSNGTTTGYLYSDNNGVGLFNGATATGTGIYARTSNILDLYYNGSIGLRLNNLGRILIGSTTDYGEQLQVTGTGRVGNTTGGDFRITTNQANGTIATPLNMDLSFLGYADGVRARIRAVDQSGNTNASYLSFFVNTNAGSLNENMRITSTSNLLIGSTTDSGERLQVTGTAKITGASTLSGGVTLGHTGGVAITYPSGQAIRSVGGIFVDYGNGGTGDLVFRRGSGVLNTLILAVSDGAATFSSSVTAASGIITGNLTVDTNTLFVDATNNRVGVLTTTPSEPLHVAGNMLISGANSFKMRNLAGTDVNVIRAVSGGTSVLSTATLGNNIAIGTQSAHDFLLCSSDTERIRLSSSGWFSHTNATNPSSSVTDSYVQYSADVTAGNAAPHFRTENGAVIKLYQETTAVGNSIISLGGGNSVLDDTTFDGYTLRQIVKALRNQGILA